MWITSALRLVGGRGWLVGLPMQDLAYFNRRAQEEREAAGRSASATVRKRHLEFAEAYESKVRELSETSSNPKLHVVDAA